jgi:hypothetical protein
MRDRIDAGQAGDPLFVAAWQRLNDGNLVTYHEPIRTSHGHAGGKRLLDGAEEAEEKESDEDREKGQGGTQLLPLEISPDESKEFHGGSSVESCPLSR